LSLGVDLEVGCRKREKTNSLALSALPGLYRKRKSLSPKKPTSLLELIAIYAN